MNIIRQIMLENRISRKSTHSQANCEKIYSFMVHKSNNTIVRPYCIYPIMAFTENHTGFMYSANSVPWKPSTKGNKTEKQVLKPKVYQRLSLHRAKAKQLSSYGGKTFSLGRDEWRQRSVLPTDGSRQSKTYFKTKLLKILPHKSQQHDRQQKLLQFRREGEKKQPRRKISDRRVVHQSREIENRIDFRINGWETFDESNKE